MDHKRDKKHPVLIILLNLLSFLFKLISLILLKIKSLKKHRFNSSIVISIDSLSFGGIGKSPALIKIGQILKEEKIKFAIITRGYKSNAEKTSIEITDTDSAESIGDEALMFKKIFPNMDIYSGKKRIESINKAIQKGNRVIILDDGFQSTHIKKDVKILLYNQFHPYYYLRNFKFLIKREDLIFSYRRSLPLKTGSCSEDGLYHFEIKDCFTKEGKKFKLNQTSLLAFCALGDNQRFKESLDKFNIKAFFPFRDHHPFSQTDLDKLDQQRKDQRITHLLCTFKDFVKIKDLNLTDIPLLYITNQIIFNFDLKSYLLKRIKKSAG